ncbi:hypothetical protein R1sor_018129 [Riccia sorocarpa]|uniref:Uncharacterized protein n=1 Tax=Riccia sorocarpa TaxID=122646 RepID=A0ABD3ICW5_9MARC
MWRPLPARDNRLVSGTELPDHPVTASSVGGVGRRIGAATVAVTQQSPKDRHTHGRSVDGQGGDKRKTHMVQEEDVGIEEGELLNVDPPPPKAVLRSNNDKKRKKHALEEKRLLALTLLQPYAEEKIAETARRQATNDEKYQQNIIFKHRWFVRFTQKTNNRTSLELKFFTPGSIKETYTFHSHSMELATLKFLEEKDKPGALPWETFVLEMSQRLWQNSRKFPRSG